jgi:hypothetical protein
MKILLAIFTCHKYQYTTPGSNMKDWFTRPVTDRVSGIRDSWLKDVTGDYKFFYGRGDEALRKSDTVFLNAPDDYLHSAEKLKALVQWALANGYDKLVKIDDDMYVYYDRLMANVPTEDYVGSSTGPVRTPTGVNPGNAEWWKKTAIYCSGCTYWLSKKAMEVLATAPAGCWAEDRWCGETLFRNKIFSTINNRYYIAPHTRTCQYITDEELYKPNNYLTIHSLSPDQMRRYYNSLKNS